MVNKHYYYYIIYNEITNIFIIILKYTCYQLLFVSLFPKGTMCPGQYRQRNIW